MSTQDAYTFVCLAHNEVATAVDIQILDPASYRQHALQLLRDHASAQSVEVWRAEAVVDRLDRSGVRAAP